MMAPIADALEARSPSGSTGKGRSRSTRSSSSRSTATGRVLHPARGAGGPGATSSPAPRSARSSARWWPARSTAGGATLGAPDPFLVVEAGAGRGRLAADVLARRARVRRRAALRAGRALAARCAPSSASCSPLEPFEDALGPLRRATTTTTRRAGRRHRARSSPRSTSSRRRRSTASCSPTSCSTTSRSEVVERTRRRAGRGAGRRRRRRASSRRWCPRRRARGRGRPRGRVDVADRRAGCRCRRGVDEWLAARARACCAAACSSSSTTPRPRRELVDAGPARVAAHVPRPRARRRSPLDAPGDAGHHHRRRRSSTLRRTREPRRASRSSSRQPQAEWLRDLGVDELVAEARATWDGRAPRRRPRGARHRSRVTEAAALIDPAGLGAHRVLVVLRADDGRERRGGE